MIGPRHRPRQRRDGPRAHHLDCRLRGADPAAVEQTSPMITDGRRLLVAGRVDPQHPQPGAVVDGGELVVLTARGDAGQGCTNLTSIWTQWPCSCFS